MNNYTCQFNVRHICTRVNIFNSTFLRHGNLETNAPKRDSSVYTTVNSKSHEYFQKVKRVRAWYPSLCYAVISVTHKLGTHVTDIRLWRRAHTLTKEVVQMMRLDISLESHRVAVGRVVRQCVEADVRRTVRGEDD